MARCELCMRAGQSGNSVSHSKHRTKRRWSVNVQRATIYVKGEPRRVRICTRCLRSQNKHALKG